MDAPCRMLDMLNRKTASWYNTSAALGSVPGRSLQAPCSHFSAAEHGRNILTRMLELMQNCLRAGASSAAAAAAGAGALGAGAEAAGAAAGAAALGAEGAADGVAPLGSPSFFILDLGFESVAGGARPAAIISFAFFCLYSFFSPSDLLDQIATASLKVSVGFSLTAAGTILPKTGTGCLMQMPSDSHQRC